MPSSSHGKMKSIYNRSHSIGWLHLTSLKRPQLGRNTLRYIIGLFVRTQGKKVVSSTVILEMQTAWNLPSTTVSTVTVAQLPCQLN